MNKLLKKTAALSLLLACQATLAETPDVVPSRLMGLDLARDIAEGAIAACRKDGYQAAVVVTDRSGDPLVVMRDVFVSKYMTQIAHSKANAVVMSNSSSAELRVNMARIRDELNLLEGVLLMILFAMFLIVMLRISRNAKDSGDPLAEEQESEIPDGVSNKAALVWVVVGLFLLPYAASMLVDSAVTIAKFFGMSDLVIGLTIIAIGTSLPELADEDELPAERGVFIVMELVDGESMRRWLARGPHPCLRARAAVRCWPREP